MEDRPGHRRLSKLALLPMLLSVGAWISLGAAVISVVAMAEVRSPPHWGTFIARTEFAVLLCSLLGLAGFSTGSLATGGMSFLRVQLERDQVRGRGCATAGCLSTLTPLLLVAPFVLGGLLIFVFFFACMVWMASSNPAGFH